MALLFKKKTDFQNRSVVRKNPYELVYLPFHTTDNFELKMYYPIHVPGTSHTQYFIFYSKQAPGINKLNLLVILSTYLELVIEYYPDR